MALIGPLSNLFSRQLPDNLQAANLKGAGATGLDNALADLTKLAPTGAPATTTATPTVTPTGTPSFGKIMEKMVGEVNDKMQTAASDQAKVLTGESTNLHQAMISMQEASVSFSLMTEVRNKLVDSYQELMRMQV
jgi:flagellar hook-basal body complex protein FliE